MSRTFRKIPCKIFKEINKTDTENMKLIKFLKLIAKRIFWRIKEAHEPDELQPCRKTSGVKTCKNGHSNKDKEQNKADKLSETANCPDGMLKVPTQTAVAVKIDDDAKQKKQYTEYIKSKNAKRYYKNLTSRTARRKNKEIERNAKNEI